MQNTMPISFEEATGNIPYNMTNNYMFRYILQKNEKVLRGLIVLSPTCAVPSTISIMGKNTRKHFPPYISDFWIIPSFLISLNSMPLTC